MSPETARKLRELLARHLEIALDEDELTEAVRDFAHEARARRIPPEKLLKQLHALWDEVIESRRPASAQERRRLRERLIALCIEHYFAVGLLVTAAAGAWLRRA